MTPQAISAALGQRLAGMTGVPGIVWPNKAVPLPARPYLVAQIVRGRTTAPALAGGPILATGTFVVTVVHELNGFATAAETLAASVAARFPKGLRPAAGLTITDVPHIDSGYADDVSWRVPVLIPWKTAA